MMSDATPNTLADKVFEFIEYTNQSVFLTGKAGTGKTTLLKKIKANTAKKMVVIAPTGVAAINAKGTTINSFFQLPPGSFFPGDISFQHLQSGITSIKSTVSDLSYNRDKLKLFNELELLVIDEVSMVRCDVLDVIDAILRSVRKNNLPFGGVQLLLIGDLYQLPPVTKREDWAFLSRAYPSPYFFDSLVIRNYPVLQIELTTVYRQTEETFIKILNDIRNNQIDEEDLKLLNERYEPEHASSDGLNPIIITSHNAEATAINNKKLDEIDAEEFVVDAEIDGDFKELGLQAEQQLRLKVGAQVMFIKNDTGEERKFYNGKIGKIEAITNGEIFVAFPNEDSLLLQKSSWQSFEYKINEDDVVSQQQVGEFSQYPIKLAWAVTIHKSQGLTFDHAIIDAGKSFIAGQVYVALSRVKTLNGLILKSKINKDSLRSNREVLAYLKPLSLADLDELLIKSQEEFILKIVLDHFSFASISNELESISNDNDVMKAHPELKAQFKALEESIIMLTAVLEKFQTQIKQLHHQGGFAEQASLHERIMAAKEYFVKELNLKTINPILKLIRIKPKNKIQQQLQHQLQKLRQHIEHKINVMQIGANLLATPIDTRNYVTWIEKHRKQALVAQDRTATSNSSVNLQLF